MNKKKNLLLNNFYYTFVILVFYLISDLLVFYKANIIISYNYYLIIWLFLIFCMVLSFALFKFISKKYDNFYNYILVSVIIILFNRFLERSLSSTILIISIILLIVYFIKFKEKRIIFIVFITFYILGNLSLNIFNILSHKSDQMLKRNVDLKEKFSEIFANNLFIIVLDTHPSAKTIKQNYPELNFFINFLEKKNFKTKSYINNIYKGDNTLHAISSILTSKKNYFDLGTDQYVKGDNLFRDLARKNGSKFIFLDGGMWDNLLECNKNYIDICYSINNDNSQRLKSHKKYKNFQNFKFYLGGIYIFKFSKLKNLILENLLKVLYNNYIYDEEFINNKYDEKKFLLENYRGLVKEFIPEIKKLKAYTPFTIYAHFLNPHAPFSRDENCKKVKLIEKTEIARVKFMICTDKMVINLINEIDKVYNNEKYSILIISDNDKNIRQYKNQDLNKLNFFSFYSNFNYANNCKIDFDKTTYIYEIVNVINQC